MTERKVNCWEFKKCGREVGGAKTVDLGVCPASIETRLSGVHGGRNAGRSCWVVAGTLCKGQVQGVFAGKFSNCRECDFYKAVNSEEGARFKLSAGLLAIIKDDISPQLRMR